MSFSPRSSACTHITALHSFRLDITRSHADWLLKTKDYANALKFDQLNKYLSESSSPPLHIPTCAEQRLTSTITNRRPDLSPRRILRKDTRIPADVQIRRQEARRSASKRPQTPVALEEQINDSERTSQRRYRDEGEEWVGIGWGTGCCADDEDGVARGGEGESIACYCDSAPEIEWECDDGKRRYAQGISVAFVAD